MVELAGWALVLSIDNLRLTSALALLGAARGRWWRLALLMAAVEAAFPLLGAAIGPALPLVSRSLEPVGPALLIGAAALSVAGALSKPSAAGAFLYALPPLFAIDNLLAGAALGQLGFPVASIALVSVASGGLSLLTMMVSGSLARAVGGRWRWGPAALALALGVSTFLFP